MSSPRRAAARSSADLPLLAPFNSELNMLTALKAGFQHHAEWTCRSGIENTRCRELLLESKYFWGALRPTLPLETVNVKVKVTAFKH
jgi:hypothetical protein